MESPQGGEQLLHIGQWRRESRPDAERYHAPFSWQIAGQQLCIQQSRVTSPKTVGLTIWDCSLVLSKYLERLYFPEGLKGKKILELGSGCGLAGISAGNNIKNGNHLYVSNKWTVLLGAEVLFTDVNGLEQLQNNINSNVPVEKQHLAHTSFYSW